VKTVLPELQLILEPGVCGFDSAIPADAARLHAVERLAVKSSSGTRLAEFAAGRHCAHQVLMQLGIRETAVPVGYDRSPVWPATIVGSISHSRACAVAIAAHATEDLLSLGVDVEDAEPIEEDLMEQIGTPSEYALLFRAGCVPRELASRLLFSLKESAFKCLYQWSGAFLDFADLRLLHLGRDHDFAMGRLTEPAGAVAERVVGRFSVGRDQMCSTATLRCSGIILPR
jgi:4'-phosphopantetheinyl transferase EntD